MKNMEGILQMNIKNRMIYLLLQKYYLMEFRRVIYLHKDNI
jgi:hypothetical protein